jgi:hypothetical protein
VINDLIGRRASCRAADCVGDGFRFRLKDGSSRYVTNKGVWSFLLRVALPRRPLRVHRQSATVLHIAATSIFCHRFVSPRGPLCVICTKHAK